MTKNRNSPKIHVLPGINNRQLECSWSSANTSLECDHIGKGIQCNVRAQVLKNQSLWLECKDTSSVCDPLGEEDRVGANVGPNVHRYIPRLEHLSQNIEFTFTPFAIVV